jgi:single stranded DNA-binding protein
MYNKVTLIGRLTKDPIQRMAKESGKQFAVINLAVNSSFNRDVVDFIDVTLFDKAADICLRYLKKGRMVCIEGKLKNRKIEDIYKLQVSGDTLTILDRGLDNKKEESLKEESLKEEEMF